MIDRDEAAAKAKWDADRVLPLEWKDIDPTVRALKIERARSAREAVERPQNTAPERFRTDSGNVQNGT